MNVLDVYSPNTNYSLSNGDKRALLRKMGALYRRDKNFLFYFARNGSIKLSPNTSLTIEFNVEKNHKPNKETEKEKKAREKNESNAIYLLGRWNTQVNTLSQLSHINYVEMIKEIISIPKEESMLKLISETLNKILVNLNVENLSKVDINGIASYEWILKLEEGPKKTTMDSNDNEITITPFDVFWNTVKNTVCGEGSETILSDYISYSFDYYSNGQKFKKSNSVGVEMGIDNYKREFYRVFEYNVVIRDGKAVEEIEEVYFYYLNKIEALSPSEERAKRDQIFLKITKTVKYVQFVSYMFTDKSYIDESGNLKKDLRNALESKNFFDDDSEKTAKSIIQNTVKGICFYKMCYDDHPLFGIHCMLDIICAVPSVGTSIVVKLLNDILSMNETTFRMKIVLNVVNEDYRPTEEVKNSNKFYTTLGFKRLFDTYYYSSRNKNLLTTEFHKQQFTKTGKLKVASEDYTVRYNTMVLDLTDDESRKILEAKLTVIQNSNNKLDEVYFTF